MSELKIEEIINRYFPAEKIIQIEQLHGGISAQTTAVTLSQKKVIIRVVGTDTLAYNPQVAQQEFATLSLLQKLNIPAPRPLFLDDSLTYAPTPFLILDYLPGAPNYHPKDLPAFATQIAQQLARIHQMPLTPEIQASHPTQMARMNRWFAPTNIRERNRLSSKIWALLSEKWPFANLNPTALLHGDYWPGNMLWQDEQLTAVIDWEESELGDPLADVGIARLDILFLFGQEAMQIFTDAYQQANPISFTNQPYWDLHAAFRPGSDLHLWAAGWDKLGRPEVSEAMMATKLDSFAAEAFRKVR